MTEALAVTHEEMTRVLDVPPVAVTLVGQAGTAAVTHAWRHGALHGRVAGMADHVFMTYTGAAHPIERRAEGRAWRSKTRRGTVTLIAAGSEACWDIDGEIGVIHFYISPERLAALAGGHGLSEHLELVDRTASSDENGSRLLMMLAQAAAGPTKADELFAEYAGDLLGAHLLRAHSSRSLPAPTASGGLAPWQLRRVTDCLEDRLAERMTLAELATLVDLSTFHFCRAFKQSTGLPPHRWRAARRIERARELLEATDLSVIDIALQVGYEGPGQFAAAFRQATGILPTQYRRRRDT